MSELNLPLLYRHILRAAQRFPSIKRDSIVQEIKAEFAANKGLTAEKEVTEKRQLAVSSLRQLEEYIGISHDESQIYLRGPANTA
ncbi:g3636 [Coccomyxa viridis]|uniref:G3636 protein n=1 Tax=Coccomyxa viridis TaxID=1274662 RepID=A0ABP1FNA5_9CHLO